MAGKKENEQREKEREHLAGQEIRNISMYQTKKEKLFLALSYSRSLHQYFPIFLCSLTFSLLFCSGQGIKFKSSTETGQMMK